ncbi:AbrB/MazE/SpoVT family DNA-binding domain-containing protein [Candidatus Woesebacteria bacterium]|nr:AbrB/MazE/SpoVT family DNA-binding domain-containing protein [Candidatus Woesebacteria bacterium]
MNTTRITKIGNSKGIIIPSEIIKALALDEGDEVELSYDPNSQILSSKFPNSKQLKLVSSGSDLEGSAQPEGKVRP